MQRSGIVYRRIVSLLNGMSVVLVVAGVIDFFFFGHNYERSQLYLIVALATLVVAAVVSRMTHNVRTEDADVDEVRPHENAPAWIYGFVGVCIFLAILSVFTDLFRSVVIDFFIVMLLAIVLVKIASDLYRSGFGTRMKLNRIQWFGITLGVFVLMLDVYRLMIMLFRSA